MSTDPTPTPEPTPVPDGQTPADQPAAEDRTFTQADVDRIIQGRLSKFSDYDEIKTQLAAAQTANQTEAEKAIAAAKDEGRKEASSELGRDLARERFDALAGRRNSTFDTAQALEFVDLAKFLSDDGKVNTEAITAAVERLVPAAADGPPSFDGGTRTPAPAPQGMNGLIRKATGRA